MSDEVRPDRDRAYPAFKVIDALGHVFCVYADGRTEGFGKDLIVVNNIPFLCKMAIEDAREFDANGKLVKP